MWDLFYESEKVRTMLTRKIQEESLRTYLFTYSKVYDSISVATLAEMFELDKGEVHAIVSKMIISEELMASLDEPTECMVSGIYTCSKMLSQVILVLPLTT